ncbi:hypothetical protein NDU88_007274 [Pleurodeles waltl]|uniref:Uncharacterized protein n=1 Tax=Pleurodeles waltl TaxID=8319 RepID=A0AAV7RRE0_PLEWA|nr:hypothetical protein NDU88_007274 [Pleurodeles waltl]
MGATAPVAPSHSAGSIRSRLPRGKGFPAGLAGGLLAVACQPSGKARMASAVFRPRSGHVAVPARRAATAARRPQNEALSLFPVGIPDLDCRLQIYAIPECCQSQLELDL